MAHFCCLIQFSHGYSLGEFAHQSVLPNPHSNTFHFCPPACEDPHLFSEARCGNALTPLCGGLSPFPEGRGLPLETRGSRLGVAPGAGLADPAGTRSWVGSSGARQLLGQCLWPPALTATSPDGAGPGPPDAFRTGQRAAQGGRARGGPARDFKAPFCAGRRTSIAAHTRRAPGGGWSLPSALPPLCLLGVCPATLSRCLHDPQ